MPLQPPRRHAAPVLRTKDDILQHPSEVIDSGDQKRLIAALSDITRAARQLLSFDRIDASISLC
jgi:hypothetical protein